MSIICPHDGHIIDHPTGDFCSDHGAKWFVKCPACGAPWPTKASGQYARTSLIMPRPAPLGRDSATGSDFCAGCGTPGVWLERPQLMEWLRSNVKVEVSASQRFELLEVLMKLEAMDANDTKTVTGWEQVKKLAPQAWEKSKPVRDALIGEAVKKLLGL